MSMSAKEFNKLVETLDLEDGIKEKVQKAIRSLAPVPDEWDDETHLLREVAGTDGNNYLLIQEDDSFDFRAIQFNKDGGFNISEGTYISKMRIEGFTGRKAVMVDARIPDDVSFISPGERFTGEHNGIEAILTRTEDEGFPWAVCMDYDFEYAKDSEVVLHHRLVEV